MAPAIVLSLLSALPVQAATKGADSVFLEDLTWPELRAAIAAGKTTVLLPVGGTEQNGPHMALGKHNMRARTLAGMIAAKLGNALVAPVLAYVPEGNISPPTGHMMFPGTISIPDDAFQATLHAAALSFRQHGFVDVVLLGDHGGYQSQLKSVAARLNRGWGAGPARAHFVAEYYQSISTNFAQALRAKGVAERQIGNHAGALDTALTLALDPGMVRTTILPGGPDTKPEEAPSFSGDPRAATAALGRLGVELVVANTVNAISLATRRRGGSGKPSSQSRH